MSAHYTKRYMRKKKKQGTVRVKCGLHLPKNRENIFYHTIIIQGFQKVKM